MTVSAFRICKREFAHSAFDGQGAFEYGGRWNRKGSAIVYVSGSFALAQLEFVVHTARSDRKKHYAVFAVEIPNTVIEELDPVTLPPNWRKNPIPAETRDIGTKWAAASRSAALRVPSVIVPREFNFLLNPAHADFPTIRITRIDDLVLDRRI